VSASPSPGPYLLEMLSITKSFGSVTALCGASLRVRRGEIHGLIGENGAGKSTLMKILHGAYPVGSYEGQVRIAGSELELHSPHDALRQGVGVVPQEISVIDGLTVGENVFLGRLGNRRMVRLAEVEAEAATFLGECGIPLDARDPVSDLTAGEKQLVMIARALQARPSILLLDEPTSPLTHVEVDILFGLLRHLRDGGLTTIFISHKLSEVFAICDRVSVMRDGEVVDDFTPDDFDANRVAAAMIGRRLNEFFPARSVSRDRAAEVLRVDDLVAPHAKIPGKNVLDGVSFGVQEGEIVGIAGLLGSGRSELVNAIYGRFPRSAGTITVEGSAIDVRAPADAINAGIGLVVEDRKQEGLLFNVGIRENVTLNCLRRLSRLLFVRRAAERRMARQAMDEFGILAPSAATRISHLSGGNQQKVLVARTLLPHPRILLLDEPTKGIDVGAKAEIYRLIRDLADDGVGVVVISSEFSELLGLCDRILVLSGGRITKDLAVSGLTEQTLMAQAMVQAPPVGTPA